MFGYGLISVVLALYLGASGLEPARIGLLLTLTLVGDAAISLWLTIRADRAGRRRTLIVGSALMVLAGATFAATGDFWLLLVAAIVGVISPSGNEVGPFLPIEQSALAQVVRSDQRTGVFAWYQLAGSAATASGALFAGVMAQALIDAGSRPVDGYRAVVVGYAVLGGVLFLGFLPLSRAIEPPRPSADRLADRFGLHGSRRTVFSLAALFALDSFGGGFVIQSVVALWLAVRWGIEPVGLGAVFFGANLLAGASALAAVPLARRFGLVRTMVWTHLPSNLLLILVPLMPSAALAVTVLVARFAISQMDVPTRQSYVMAVVAPDERSAAAGITGVIRSLGAALSPSLAVPLVALGGLAAGIPFFLAGGLKIAYDLGLWRRFRAVRPVEEVEPRSAL